MALNLYIYAFIPLAIVVTYFLDLPLAYNRDVNFNIGSNSALKLYN